MKQRRIPTDRVLGTRIQRIYRFQCRDCGDTATYVGAEAIRLAHRIARAHTYDTGDETEVVRITYEYERIDE